MSFKRVGVLTPGFAFVAGPIMALPLINEFQPNPLGGGADPSTQQIELIGTPLAPFVGVLVALDSDTPGTTGVTGKINEIIPIDASFDANGLLTITVNDMENPSLTLVLAESYTGNTLTDLDTDDDGTIDDFSFFGTVFDAIGIPDSVGDQSLLYGTDFGGQDFAYTGAEPALIFRDRTTGQWYAFNGSSVVPDDEEIYDLSGTNVDRALFVPSPDPAMTSFGSHNPATIPTSIPGDTDSDGDIDDSDLGTAFANYTGPVGAVGGKLPADGDSDGDGDVDDSDLGTAFAGYTGPLGPADVPEPSGLALLGLGGLPLARRRRS